jgi:hypothetical protein
MKPVMPLILSSIASLGISVYLAIHMVGNLWAAGFQTPNKEAYLGRAEYLLAATVLSGVTAIVLFVLLILRIQANRHQ